MEKSNDALKLVANALQLLKNPSELDEERFQRCILMLEEAVDKLAM